MADLLVQNAVEAVKSAITSNSTGYDWNSMLGRSLNAEIKAIIEGLATDGPFTVAGGSARNLCHLTDRCLLSHCSCNYFGGSQACTATSPLSDNPWNDGSVLSGGSSSKTQADIITANDKSLLRGGAGASKKLNIVYQSNNAVEDDYYFEYLALLSTFTSEGNTNVLSNWYGVGAGDAQGAKMGSNVLKVCGADWISGQGASCTWTVPAGVTRAKFQVWGAGMGSNPACCCGGAPWSSSGAYAEAVVDVTAGQQYVVCAGCSCSRRCCSNNPPGCGCMSGVTGPHICCLKADGAGNYTDNCNNMNYIRCMSGYAGSACYRVQNPYCTTSGACWCSYSEYCFGGSCDWCGMIPVYPNCCSQQTCSCMCVDKNPLHGPERSFRGTIGGGCFDSNHYGRMTAPPVLDADTGLRWQPTGYCYCAYADSGSCCGGCSVTCTWLWHPGMGGAYTHVMGGSNTHKGDTGRGGMVQISWA